MSEETEKTEQNPEEPKATELSEENLDQVAGGRLRRLSVEQPSVAVTDALRRR